MDTVIEEREDEQSHFSTILDHIPALIYLRDRNGRFQLVNTFYERMYGVKREDVVGRTLHEVLPSEYADLYAARDAEIIKTGKAIEHETRLRGSDGERVFSATKFPIFDGDGSIAAVGGIAVEITERRKAEAALQHSESTLVAMMESSPIGASIVQVGGAHEFVNGRMLRMLGVSRQEMMEANARDFYVDPTDRDAVYARLERDGSIRDMELHLKRADGTPFWALASFEPADIEGRSRYFAWVYDITERKQAEFELQRSRDIFQALADNLPEFITMKDPDGCYLFANKSFEEWTGHDRTKVIGKTYREIYTPEQVRSLSELDRGVLESGEPFTRETTFKYPDGNPRTVVATRFPVTSFDGTQIGVGHINHDVTERRQAEEQRLRQYQKMELMGQLTSSVSHDFNNVLTVLECNIHLLKSAVGDSEKGQALIANCAEALDLGTKLTDRLMQFARKDEAVSAVVDLDRLIHGCRELLRKSVGNACSVEFVLPEAPMPVLVDATLVEVALLNVVNNARDAMPDDGTVTVSLRDAVPDSGVEPACGKIEERAYVLLEVADTGSGMTAETKSRVFDAFFTTKARGEGTGLGLSTVRDLAKNAGGFVEIDSEPGEGTAIRVFLPLQGGAGDAAGA